MKPERLRGWLRKYGNLGTLMVGGYLAIHYLSKRRAAMLVVCCLLLLSLIYLLPRLITPVTKLHRSPVMPPNPVVSSEPHQRVAAPPVDPDELRSSQTVMIGKDPWTFEIWRRHPPNDDMIQFYRNGQFVESVKSEELGNIYCGQNFAVRLMHFPTRYPVIEVRVNSGAGHGQVTRFYSVRNGQLLNMGEVEAECGGPVFRGRDRDRKLEWVFDDYDPHIYHDRGPEFYEVYKQAADGNLVFWKELPNKRHRHVPDPFWKEKLQDGALAPVSLAFIGSLGIRLGVDTETRLESRIGKGEVTIGGHSNSGRAWFFRNGLQLLADGFDCSQESYILDTLVFSGWKGELGATQELANLGLGVWSKLRVGMSQKECLSTLPDGMPAPTITGDKIAWQRDEPGVRAGRQGKFHYVATLRFTHGRLDDLLLEGYLVQE